MMISKRECKKRIEKLVSKKKYSNIDFYLFEIYINIYLLLLKERKLAQVSIYKRGDLFTIPKIKKLLDKIYPYYENDDNTFVLYHKKYEINKMNRTYTKKYAQNLGSFYVCAGDSGKLFKRYTYLLRPLIRISYQNQNQLNHTIEFELYAQMCPPRTVTIKNILFFYDIEKRLNKILNKIHPNIHAYFTIETYNSSK